MEQPTSRERDVMSKGPWERRRSPALAPVCAGFKK